MAKAHKGPRKNIIRRSLTAKALLTALTVSAFAWMTSDFISAFSVRRAFEEQLEKSLAKEAQTYRFRFGQYSLDHSVTAMAVAAQKSFYDYVDAQDWTENDVFEVKINREIPAWFANNALQRSLVAPGYAFLLDPWGKTREAHQHASESPPHALLHPSQRLLTLTKDDYFLATIEGKLYMLASRDSNNDEGEPLATLLIASAIDENYLFDSQGTAIRNIIVALVDEETDKVITSSELTKVPVGASLGSMGNRFLITDQKMYSYGNSEMVFKFVSMTDRTEVDPLIRKIVNEERLRTGAQTAVFFGAFILVLLWITRRVSRVTQKVEEFSLTALGGRSEPYYEGDQLKALEIRFQALTEEVVAAAETIRKESEEKIRRAAELDRKTKQAELLKSITEALGVGVMLRGGREMHAKNTQMQLFISQIGDIEKFQIEQGSESLRQIVDSKGEIRTFAIQSPVLDFDEQVILARDVTEQKRAESSLKESEERFRQLADASWEAVIIHEEGLLLQANDQYFEMFGYKPEELMGKQVFPVVFTEESVEIIWQKIKSGDLAPYEITGRRKDGEEFPIEIRVRMMNFHGRKVRVGAIRDLTERKDLERKLIQSQKMEALGTLASGIAHDFNNLLQAISGHAEILLIDPTVTPDDVRKRLSRIMRASASGSELVKGLLTVGRKTKPELKALKLNILATHTLSLLERTIPKMIRIETRLDEDLDLINGDSTQVEQILMNLGTNARDAMPNGGRLLIETENVFLDKEYCKTHPEAQEGEHVLLRISDTGEGIDKETATHIFEPFFTTKASGKGTGLGLSTVYGIVRSHGGHVNCYSEIGKGTVFSMYFPAEKIKSKKVVPAPRSSDDETRRGDEHILVVDDEEDMRALARAYLKKNGYTVQTAKSGEEALDIIRKTLASQNSDQHLHLVLLDLGMPGMGGQATLQEIKKLDPAIKVLVASGYSAQEQDEDIFESGADGYIRKPYLLETLARKVREILDA